MNILEPVLTCNFCLEYFRTSTGFAVTAAYSLPSLESPGLEFESQLHPVASRFEGPRLVKTPNGSCVCGAVISLAMLGYTAWVCVGSIDVFHSKKKKKIYIRQPHHLTYGCPITTAKGLIGQTIPCVPYVYRTQDVKSVSVVFTDSKRCTAHDMGSFN
ncbi:hypothetical protein RchiOBHm_Chr4g0437371 [Rosa chinensis]|uniref:Uncharacterized protein n=1 Tax=Rosa chinensis TaxID=74649 RepID=A0A2P6R299_ROSCH|nr:hypothetical protein RchiOBHm_Chr4g0437371 [Rosa chinensis]